MTLLDGALPEYDFRERHERYVPAPPHETDRAVRAVTLGDSRLANLLFLIRTAPARLMGRRRGRRATDVPILEQALDLGFGVLGDKPGDEVVVGMIGQPWKLAGGGQTRRFERPEEFVAFDTPGFVKAAMNFRFESVGAGTRLSTETRILATDPISRRRFRRYWFVIRGGSGLTRRAWLRAAARRAQRSPVEYLRDA